MYLRQATVATRRFGPFLDSTDGVTPETGLTIAQADMQLSKDGGAFAQKNASGSATHDTDGWYSTSFDTTDTTTVGELWLQINVSGALPVWVRYWVLEEGIYDSLFAFAASGFNTSGLVTLAAVTHTGATIPTVTTTTTNTDMRGTDSAALATAVAALNDFDPAADTVANVTLVATTTTNTDMRGTDSAATAAQVTALNDFDAATDTVANVTLVATTTTNTDMRGTDSALLAASVPTNFSSMVISGAGAVDGLLQGFINTTLTETSVGRINDNFEFFYDNSDSQTTKTVDDVGVAGSGLTQQNVRDAMKLAPTAGSPAVDSIDIHLDDILVDTGTDIPASITALNDFDPTSDTVAQVTLVTTTTTNTDMRGTDSAALATAVAALNDFDPATDTVVNVTTVGTTNLNADMRGTDSAATAVQVAGLNDFDPALDTVASVTLVATTTTNTDMRGTDGANTVAPDNAGISANGVAIAALNDFDPAIDTVASVTLVGTTTTNTDMRGTDSANTVAPDNASITAILVDTGTSIPAQITGLNDISAADVWSEATRTLTAFSFTADCDVQLINGATVLGNGTAGDLWRG